MPTVANGTFSSDASNWTGTNATLASIAGGQSGNCLQITRTGADLQVAASDAITVVSGSLYTLTIWVKSGTSGAESFRATIEEAGVEKAVTGGTSSASWVAYRLSYLASAASCVIKLVKNTATAGTMLFDTVTLEEIPVRVYASTIFTDAGKILLDETPTRWLDAEKLVYLNAGQRDIVILKPDAYAINDVYLLTAGTKQSLPDGTASFLNASGSTMKECIQFFKLVRNMGTDGLTSGAAIPPIGMDFMDSINPDWHSVAGAAAVQNFMFDERDTKHFYVYPANLGTGYVETSYSAVPDDVVAAAGPSYDVSITLSNIYRQALTDYILFRCYAKDAALSPYNAQRAVEFWNLFVAGLGRMDLIKNEVSPNVARPNPSTEG